MSLVIQTIRSTDLPLRTAQQIRDGLTKPKSQTQQDMDLVISVITGNSPSDIAPDFFLAIATVTNPYTDELECIGWASATVWDRLPCLQAFVKEDYRQMGLASALASSLVVDHHFTRDMPIGVFSNECALIARSIGFGQIQQYKRVEDGWIRVETFDGRRREADEIGVFYPQGPMRHLPLADGT